MLGPTGRMTSLWIMLTKCLNTLESMRRRIGEQHFELISARARILRLEAIIEGMEKIFKSAQTAYAFCGIDEICSFVSKN